VDEYQFVMKANSDFIQWEDFVLHPVPTVSEQCAEPIINVMNWHTEIYLVRLPVFPGPLPRFVEHAPM
jgi:hypothetical protein